MIEIWQYIIAFWLAGVLLAMWKIYFPSLKIIKSIVPNNIIVQHPVLSTIVVFIMFTLFLPFMVLPLLIPNRLEKFASGFISGAVNSGENIGKRKD